MGRLKERHINVVYLVVDKDANEALNLYEDRIDADNRAKFLSDESINHKCIVWSIELIPSKQKEHKTIYEIFVDFVTELDEQGILDNANDAKKEAIKLIEQFIK